ncbi:MAG: nucleoside triphosphate pyrophosphatase [Patescibacteria group bacterium]|jgi:septum formation protein
MKKIILASNSPRRKQILKITGLPFTVVASNYKENMDLKMNPLKLAKFLSQGKVKDVAKKYSNHLIIGADTFVVLKNKLLGKPKNSAAARIMLKKISGQIVDVITGFSVLDSQSKKIISHSQTSKIYIKKLSLSEINNYIKTGDPLDKAGAFAVQGIGALIIKKIEGDYFNIVGLPLFALSKTLKKFGISIL